MVPAKGSSFWVSVFGYVSLALGVFGMADYYFARVEYSAPQNMGIVQGNTALMLLGVTAVVIAQSLKSLEKRLGKIENTKDSGKTR
jgi:hypothetical protein